MTRDQWSGLIWVAIALFVVANSLGISIGDFHAPGPGFLPFWSAVVLAILALILVLSGMGKKKEEQRVSGLWLEVKWGRVVVVLASLFLYVILLPKIGFLILTFALLILLFSVIGQTRVWVKMVSSLLIVSITYITFHGWLKIQLPKGIFGF